MSDPSAGLAAEIVEPVSREGRHPATFTPSTFVLLVLLSAFEPPGIAAVEAIRAGDAGGRRAALLGVGILIGLAGS